MRHGANLYGKSRAHDRFSKQQRGDRAPDVACAAQDQLLPLNAGRCHDLGELPAFRRTFPEDDWTRAVEVAKEHILAGDIFQVVLSQRFDLEEPVDPLEDFNYVGSRHHY